MLRTRCHRERGRWAALGALVLALGLTACTAAAPAAAPALPARTTAPAPQPAAAPAAPPVKIAAAYASKGANQLPLWFGVERGFFAEEGIEAELVFLSSTLSGQGLLANSVQFALAGPEGIDLNLEAGGPITRYIAGVTPKLVLKTIAQPEVRSFADLRGRTVAATRQGSVTDFAWRKVLELHGLQLHRDVTALYAGTSEAVLTAVVAGHAQAGMASTPLDLIGQQQGLTILANVADMNIPYLMGGVVVRSDFLAANADVIERYLRAHLRGVHATLTDVETALNVLGKYSEVDDRELLRAGYDFWLPTLTRDQLVPEAAIVAVLQESPRPGAREANPKDFYDNSYLERIHATGFLERLYGGR